jgi:pantothenate kinase
MPDPALACTRRGAPFTFDAEAFIELVRRLRHEKATKRDDPQVSFRAPSFDHAVKDPIADDIYLSSDENLIILEVTIFC